MFQVHLWTGLIVGLYIVAIGISGSILVFKEELMPRPDVSVPAVDLRSCTPEKLVSVVERVQRAYPDKEAFLTACPQEADPFYLTTIREKGKAPRGSRTPREQLAVYSHPITGEVIGTANREESWVNWVEELHVNLLLRRSVDFDEFFPQVEANYPDELDQTIVLDLLEQLWQRGENAGYAQHLTHDPYPDVTAKHVLLLEAFGDHQVANVSTEKLARTLGVGRRTPSLADGRSADDHPFWGIDPVELPTDGSGLVTWDFGTPTPPTENLPNRAGDDPHGKLADVPEALALVLSFVRDGKIIDVCGGEPCASDG